MSRLHVATAPPQHQIPGVCVWAHVPWPVGSTVLGQLKALPGATQSVSKNVSRVQVAGPASGLGFSAHASASLRLHVRQEPRAELLQRTQRSLGPQFSSLWHPAWHFASYALVAVQ